ncbi:MULTISPECIES: serine hydrolase [Paenibacillus]|uniref:serine hydrolase domain-containing protein n=1 Tax=Paenibacillus TaxID=44249 RepID=UPI002FDFED2C
MNLTSLQQTLNPFDLRSCLISHRGEPVFRHYRDIRCGTEPAKTNSCTKSILSALICIAMDQGKLPEAGAAIADFFPQLADDPDPRKRDITLEHLLTMSAGWEWTEFGGRNSFPRMTRTSNWVDFVLAQPLAHPPGGRMEYNSGASQLLSSILFQATGMDAAAFAEQFLFGPLGIGEYKWEQDPQGHRTGGFGLWLRPADLLKFGQLYLQEGRWDEQHLISRRLAKLSVQPALPAAPPNRGRYAWHWWTDTYGETAETAFDYFYARGFGGQFVYVVPSLDIVVVLTDDKRKKDRSPVDLFRRHIAPLLVR